MKKQLKESGVVLSNFMALVAKAERLTGVNPESFRHADWRVVANNKKAMSALHKALALLPYARREAVVRMCDGRVDRIACGILCLAKA